MNENDNDNIQADDVNANNEAAAEHTSGDHSTVGDATIDEATVTQNADTTPVSMNDAPAAQATMAAQPTQISQPTQSAQTMQSAQATQSAQPTQPLNAHPMDPSSWATPTAPTAPAEPAAPKKSRTPVIAIALATAAVLCIGALGTAGVAILTRPSTSATSSTTTPTNPSRNSFGQFGQGGGQNGGQGTLPGAGGGTSGGTGGTGNTSTNSTPTASTAAEKVGVVTINTILDYDNSSQAAGTGMIISSDGLILTNNHVIEQSTSIKVTVESTGQTYTAKVVGTDATNDVAVLKLVGASGLSTVTLDPAEQVAVGDKIKSVGNAEGTGDLVTASGTVGAVNQKLTISSDFSTKGESLTGLIELNSDVVSGDSGGPLFDSDGEVIGIVTAASTGAASVTGYAINIASAIAIADKIEAGEASGDIVIGYPAFLGVGIATTGTGSGAGIAGVPIGSIFAGTPAAKAGITAGSTITKVGNTAVTSSTQLSKMIAAHKVGDQITVTWKSAAGVSHTATVTLAAGPAA